MKFRLKKFLVGLIVITVLALNISGQLFAQTGQSGRANYRGYFTNKLDYYGDFVLPAISNGQAIPSATINSVPSLMSLLKRYNVSRDPQKVTGSAFIAYTMLGRPGANYPRIVSAADWADLEARMNASRIVWGRNVIGSVNSFYQTSINDDAYYIQGRAEPGITFYNSNGSVAYQILRRCANPIGDFKGLQPVSNWSLSASSSVNKSTASPGEILQWKHDLINNGPSATNQTVYSNLQLSGFTNGWGSPVAGGATRAGARPGIIRTITAYTTYRVTPNDVGKTLCQTVQFDPSNSRGGRNGRGNPACVTVPYRYGLIPAVSLNGQTAIESGGAARVTNSVSNQGPTRSRNTDWRLTRMIFKPGATLNPTDTSARDSGSNPCGSFTSAGRTACDMVQQDAAKVFPVGTSTAPIYDYVTPTDLATGSQVCFVVSVSRPTINPNPVWRHSQLRCLIVSKKPKVQIRASDIRVGGKIETGLSTVKDSGGTNKTYGSWVEYGALSVGPNTGFASGSGLNNGGSLAPSAWSLLTFANIDDAGAPSYGNYAMPPRFASLVSQFGSAGPSGIASANVGSLGSGTYSAGDLNIAGSSIGQDIAGKGKSIVILSTGTVTISGDINYTGPGAGNSFTRIDQIPQLVIIAKNINISGAVKNIDAWLMTSGSAGIINTCSDVALAAPLNSSVCSNSLKINGLVVASHLYLRRTAGAEDGNRSGNPAEIINLRADTYLWAQNRSWAAGKAQTVFTSELPPRF